MAFKLNKDENRQHQELIDDLRRTWEKVDEAYKDPTPNLDVIRQTVADFATICDEAQPFCEQVVERLRDEFNDKSEKWQESDKASDVDQFISEWESIEFRPPDIPQDITEELDSSYSEYANILEDLPTGVD